ncbi:MAG: uncharacterized membrane protein YbaN (DUF454 family) [Halocynthiibacter sp.]|jgi:uncharacterized membrane protein YbaN (DUF454 family)
MSKLLFLSAGWIAVALGVIGIALPLLPTTPFLLLAAICFGKGSPAARAWLVDHAHLGPPIKRWEESGAINKRTKIISVGFMLAAFSLSLAMGLKPILLIIQALCLGGAATFILTRPNGDQP